MMKFAHQRILWRTPSTPPVRGLPLRRTLQVSVGHQVLLPKEEFLVPSFSLLLRLEPVDGIIVVNSTFVEIPTIEEAVIMPLLRVSSKGRNRKFAPMLAATVDPILSVQTGVLRARMLCKTSFQGRYGVEISPVMQ